MISMKTYARATLLGAGMALVAVNAHADVTSSLGFNFSPNSTGQFTINDIQNFAFVQNTANGQYQYQVEESAISSGDTGLGDPISNVGANAGFNYNGTEPSIVGWNGIYPQGLEAAGGEFWKFSLGANSSVTFNLPFWTSIYPSGDPTGSFVSSNLIVSINGVAQNLFTQTETQTGPPSPSPFNFNGVAPITISNSSQQSQSYAVTFEVVSSEDLSAQSLFVPATSTDLSTVPLPSAAWLMLSGLGGLATMARKRRAA